MLMPAMLKMGDATHRCRKVAKTRVERAAAAALLMIHPSDILKDVRECVRGDPEGVSNIAVSEP